MLEDEYIYSARSVVPEPSVVTPVMTAMMRVVMTTVVTVAMMSIAVMSMMTMMEIGVHDDRRSYLLIDRNRDCNRHLLNNWLGLIIDGLRLLRLIVRGHSLGLLGVVLLRWHGLVVTLRGTRREALRLHRTEVVLGLLLVRLHYYYIIIIPEIST